MARLKPQHIYTLGDYYATPDLQEDCHQIRKGNLVAVADAAYALAQKLPQNSILVPVPSRSGYAESLCEMMGYYARVPIARPLSREDLRNGGVYLMKKGGKKVSESDTGIYRNESFFSPGRRVVLVDTVLATGTSFSASARALGIPCEMACVAVDYDTYNKYNNTK